MPPVLYFWHTANFNTISRISLVSISRPPVDEVCLSHFLSLEDLLHPLQQISKCRCFPRSVTVYGSVKNRVNIPLPIFAKILFSAFFRFVHCRFGRCLFRFKSGFFPLASDFLSPISLLIQPFHPPCRVRLSVKKKDSGFWGP